MKKKVGESIGLIFILSAFSILIEDYPYREIISNIGMWILILFHATIISVMVFKVLMSMIKSFKK